MLDVGVRRIVSEATLRQLLHLPPPSYHPYDQLSFRYEFTPTLVILLSAGEWELSRSTVRMYLVLYL